MDREIKRQWDAARMSNLVSMLVQLRSEHSKLLQMVGEMEETAYRSDRMPDVLTVAFEMRRVKQQLISFMQELEDHTAWEADELMPLIDNYLQGKQKPVPTDSLWGGEKDRELATAYFEAFLQRLDEFGTPPHAGMVAEAVDCFIQGCILLKEHFRIEEQSVIPFVEQILKDSEFQAITTSDR